MVCRYIHQQLERKGAIKPRVQGKYTYDMDKALPGKHTMRIYGTLTREEASILTQVRTGHTYLNAYLKRVGKIDSARCACGEDNETVKHVILSCPQWQIARQELRKEAGESWNDLSYLLGGWSGRLDQAGKPMDGPKEHWKPVLKVVKATIQFLKQTARMKTVAGQYNSSQSAESAPSQASITSYLIRPQERPAHVGGIRAFLTLN